MNRNIFKLFIFGIILNLGFSSCDPIDRYNTWIDAEFDYSMPAISKNGSFKVSSRIYLRDINNISGVRYDIHDIDALSSWIQIETDYKYGFTRGDNISIDRIVINNQGLDFYNYYVTVGTALENSGVISFEEDRAYADFMWNAMKLLNQNGYIDVTVYGYSSMSSGNLFVVLANDLSLLVDDGR